MIEKLLVANRGEIARRIFRTAKALGIATVAVYSDADAGAPFVAEADEAVRLSGSAPVDTYLRGELIVQAALLTGATAVHPGYGFLSENAGFARACAEAGIIFVGPPPESIEVMGSKLASKEMMAGAGVPILPGQNIFGLADEALLKVADEIGYPVIVKASAGGGGRGMRIVESEVDLAAAVASAQREAASAFGDATCFLERYVSAPRHVEIQVFCDSHGNAVSLFERECSIQRRHQKIVEESPSTAVSPDMRRRMGEAAVAAARACGYLGAGTVEFVVDPDGNFAFLEMNTRLQVEHPVTELVTGLDLVALQLVVADGQPLPEAALNPTMTGHAIEVRLYAEDVEAGYLPSTGTLARFEVGGPGVRVDSGFETGSAVSPFYDSMLAKVIVHAPTREEASARLAGALAAARIHGVTTNRDQLVRILRAPAWLAGETQTDFLERNAGLDQPLCSPAGEAVHAVVAAFAGQAARRLAAVVQPAVPGGWRNNRAQLEQTAFSGHHATTEVGYALSAGGAHVEVDGERLDVTLLECSDETVVAEVDGVRRRYAVHLVGEKAYVDSPLGSSALTERERFPSPEALRGAGSLVAPMPGAVVRVFVSVGDTVSAGDPLLVLEAMKMEHVVASPADGTVARVGVEPGQQVELGQLLVEVDGGEEA